MNAKNLKRLESSWLLRDFAWSLKRLADRYERCCMHDANDDDERKAQVWVDRAKERLAKFRASRAEYLRQSLSVYDIDRLLQAAHRQIERAFAIPECIQLDDPKPKRNPWRAGFLPLTNRVGVVKVFFGPGEIETWDVRQGGYFTHIGEHDPFRKCGTRPLAWRPA